MALGHVDEMDDAGQADRRRARALVRPAHRTAASTPSRAAPTSCCSARVRPTVTTCGSGSSTLGRAGPRLLTLAATRRLPASDDRTAGGERSLPRRSHYGAPGVTRSATRTRGDQGDVGRGVHRPRRHRGTACSTGIPFYDHMLDQLGRHGGFDLSVTASGRPAHRHPPHRRGRRHHARRGVRARRSATRRGSAASPAGSTRSTRRSSRSPSTSPGARSSHWDVEMPESLPLGQSGVRSATRRARRVVVRHQRRHHVARHAEGRAQRAPHHRGDLQGAGQVPCATPCASTGGGTVPSTKGVL